MKVVAIDNEGLRCNGVSRDADSPGQRSILVSFNRRLTDDELRFFHGVCERTAVFMHLIPKGEG